MFVRRGTFAYITARCFVVDDDVDDDDDDDV